LATCSTPKRAERSLSVFLLGAADGVAERAASALRVRHPTLRIAGTYPGAAEDDAVVRGDVSDIGRGEDGDVRPASAQLFGDGLHTVSQIDQLTLRQQVTPARLLGRVNGTIHVLVEGVGPVGAIAGALIAEAFGIRTALWISVVGSLVGTAFLVVSPLRALRAVASP